MHKGCRHWLGIGLAALLAGMTSLPAATFELNTVKGLWQLDDSLTSPYPAVQGPLVTSGFSISRPPNSTFVTEGQTKFLAINSSQEGVFGLQPNETFRMPNTAGFNGPGGATGTHEWTLVMDVRIPSITNYVGLMQDRVDNSDEGEIFINPSLQLQLYGAVGPGGAEPVVSNALKVNTWYRLAFTSTYDSATNRQILRTYINGTITTQTSSGAVYAPVNGRYSLKSQVALFSDDSSETAVCHVNSIGYWGRALPGTDIKDLGAWKAAGLTWPNMTLPGGTPPIPPLTGKIYFGSFVGNYPLPSVSTLQVMVQTAVASTTSGAACRTTLYVPTNGGTLAGFPNRRFGGGMNVDIMNNGDAVARGVVIMNYVPFGDGPPADIQTQANVTVVSGIIRISPSGAAIAQELDVYFPAGMSVGLETQDKRGFDHVHFEEVALNSALQAAGTQTISRASFPGASTGTSQIFPCTERIPVRFATNTITWAPSTGQFSFNQGGNLAYHQESQVDAMARLASVPSVTNPTARGADIPASNDLYFLTARTVTGAVVLGGRTGGISTAHSVTMSLDPAKFNAPSLTFLTHFPLMKVVWTKPGKLVYTGGAIDTAASRLPGAKASSTAYVRGSPVAGCTGAASGVLPAAGSAWFLPTGRIWLFTADGGLRADGTVADGYNSTSDTLVGSLLVNWAGYKESGQDIFAHRITTGFTAARVITAGQSVLGTDMQGLQAVRRPVGMLLSGHSSPASSTLVERPLTAGYSSGQADYPGVNLRAAGTVNAVSRIAGNPVPAYKLDNASKYYLRVAGVSGRHLSSSTAPINFTAFGGNSFTITGLNLAFLDGINTDSGVNGAVTIPFPARIGMNFRKLLLGPTGQLKETSIDLPQPAKTLDYWGLTFVPLGLDFPQPKVCPPPGPEVGFIRIMAKSSLPGMTAPGQPVIAPLAFYGGDIVTESQPVVAGAPVATGYPRISRFEPGGLLNVPGPTGKTWNVSCLSGLYLNRYETAAGDPGLLNAAGLMDVPFFNDMEVHLQMLSNTSVGGSRRIHVRRPALAPGLTLGNTVVYDADHQARPAGVGSASSYQTLEDWNPHAMRKWQDSVNFDLPVVFNEGVNTFRSAKQVNDKVYLFNLFQEVKTMTPDQTEILLEGDVKVGIGSVLSQVNLGSLLTGTGISAVQAQLNGAMSGITSLESIVSDQIQPLLRTGLSMSATSRITGEFYNQLRNSPDRTAALNGLLGSLTNDVASLYSSSASGASGQARRDLKAKVDSAIAGMNKARELVDMASKFIDLAKGIAGLTGVSTSSIKVPDTGRIEELKALFKRTTDDLTAVSVALEGNGALSSALTSAISAQIAGQLQIRGDIQLALNDLKEKWAGADSAKMTALYTASSATALANDLTNSLTDRIGGSFFVARAQRTLREYLCDSQGMARQCVDDMLRVAGQLVAPDVASAVLNAVGLEDSLGAAAIRGYARVQGDSLQEIRLDGKLELRVPDNMVFEGYFLMRNVDSSTPGGACAAAGGAKAEILMGASADLSWGIPKKNYLVSLGGKVSLDGAGDAIGLAGDLGLRGDISLSVVTLKEVAFGFGFGANDAYLYAKASGKVYDMNVAAGVFVGRICDTSVIGKIDADIGSIVTKYTSGPSPRVGLPVTGAAVSAFGDMSLMPLIGIPPTCALDLRVGGGQAFFAFAGNNGPVVGGFKTTQRVTGELLCIASVTAQQDAILEGVARFSGGQPVFDDLAGTSRFTASAKVGVGWLSYEFRRSIGLNVVVIPAPIRFGIQF